VLRISLVEALDQAVTIWLEGQVRGPWVDELRQSCEQWLAKGSALYLDLSMYHLLTWMAWRCAVGSAIER
jgi:hypothetical protein